MMRKLGWVSTLAVAVALGGCDDDGEESNSGVGTSATAGTTDTDGPTTDTTGETTDPSDGSGSSSGGSEGGSSGEPIDCADAPSHAADIQPIWDASCVEGCHEPGGSWQSTDLTDGMAYDMLVEADGIQTMALADVQLVIPGDVANSYLVNKLNNTQADVAGAAAGTQMPQGLPPLSDEQITLVEDWIACGAEP